MKLYSYDHCPYCVKARMIFGLKQIDLQLITLLNNDEKTPISMIGQKMLPILEITKDKYLPESLDIIQYVDNLNGKPALSWNTNQKLESWFNKNRLRCYTLAMPRWVNAQLDEFKTTQAQKYFQKKKEAYIGPFTEALDNTSHLIKEMEKELYKLAALFETKTDFFEEDLSLNDIHLFPFLRSLSIVKGLSFPEKIKHYSKKMSQKTKIPLHHLIAL